MCLAGSTRLFNLTVVNLKNLSTTSRPCVLEHDMNQDMRTMSQSESSSPERYTATRLPFEHDVCSTDQDSLLQQRLGMNYATMFSKQRFYLFEIEKMRDKYGTY